MIAFIKGTVDSLSEGKMILESHGIGYELNIPASMFDAGIREGEELKIYTYECAGRRNFPIRLSVPRRS